MQARLDATLTRRDLAKAVGVTSADVRAWERGDEVPHRRADRSDRRCLWRLGRCPCPTARGPFVRSGHGSSCRRRPRGSPRRLGAGQRRRPTVVPLTRSLRASARLGRTGIAPPRRPRGARDRAWMSPTRISRTSWLSSRASRHARPRTSAVASSAAGRRLAWLRSRSGCSPQCPSYTSVDSITANPCRHRRPLWRRPSAASSLWRSATRS